MSATPRHRHPPAARAAAAALLLLLAAAPLRAAARRDCTPAAFNESSFRLALRSAGLFTDRRSQASWRRYCFALSREPTDSNAPAGGGGSPPTPPRCDAAAPCCSSDAKGPGGLESLTVDIEPACTAAGGPQKAAFSKTWWSLGARSSNARARLLSAAQAARAGAAASGRRPAFEIELAPCEREAWTATELCVNLWNDPDNPCRTAAQLCGAQGCGVAAVTTEFEAGDSSTATCCLTDQLPVPPACSPSCKNGGVCVGYNRCDCADTGYTGRVCSVSLLPKPLAAWAFDECGGNATADAAGGSGAYAWAAAGVTYARCASRGGCAVKFSAAACCEAGYPYYAECGGETSCDDFVTGSIVSIRGPPGPLASQVPAALQFDGFTSLTISAWVRVGVERGGTIAGRTWGEDQFYFGIGLPRSWDRSTFQFQACFECAPADGPCVWPGDAKCFMVTGKPVITGEWTHVAAVMKKGVLYAYQDGRLAGAPLQLPAPYDTAGLRWRGRLPISVGGHPSWNVLDEGQIDCLAFYKQGLDATQMRALHAKTRATCGCPEEGP